MNDDFAESLSPEFRQMYLVARHPQFFVDMSGKVISANASASDLFGLSPAAAADQCLADILDLPTDESAAFQKMVLGSYRSDRTDPFDMAMQCKHVGGTPVPGARGYSIYHMTATTPESLFVTVQMYNVE